MIEKTGEICYNELEMVRNGQNFRTITLNVLKNVR